MLNIVKTPEGLWRACAKLAEAPNVIASELHPGRQDHCVLAYGPVAQRNQFQSLLYSAREQFNVSLLPIHNVGLCGNIPWPGKVICHFHWLHDKTKNATTKPEADDAVSYWEDLLTRIKHNGHKIVWTVHNVMPHETIWVEQDAKIHQMMADAADALHVMASDSVKQAAPYYTLNERKVFIVPHPTYEGGQPDDITRMQARAQLHIAEDEFVFLSFGAIMKYKGYERLMAAYDRLRGNTRRRTRLIIAGLPTDKELVKRVDAWARGKTDVILDMTPVPHEKLQVYFRTADLAVCPYRRTMNSGVAMMAVTFDLPVLGPNVGGFRDLEVSGCGFTFDTARESALQEKMLWVTENPVFSKTDIAKAKTNFNPSAVSTSFFNHILRLVS